MVTKETKKFLKEVILLLSILIGSITALYKISNCLDERARQKVLSTLSREQRRQVLANYPTSKLQFEKVRIDRIYLVDAMELLNSASYLLDEGNTKGCLNEIINAKGLLAKVDDILFAEEKAKIKKEILELERELRDYLKNE